MKKILITGCSGYVGTKLLEKLSKKNLIIHGVDLMWFGNFITPQNNIQITKKDYKFISESELSGIDTVIHLASVANDPSVDLDPNFAWQNNVVSTQILLENCVKSGVKDFVFASSGSVYGVSESLKVVETTERFPISTYNQTKIITEQVCLSYSDQINIYIIRPATVCGISPRMRFDVVVNLLTLQAFLHKKITIMGGNQVRPNIHIDDMVNVYEKIIDNEIVPGIYNAGFENLTVKEIAEKIIKIIPSDFEILKSNDPRSYRQDSTKLLDSGFNPIKKVDDAINEIYDGLRSKLISDQAAWHNVEWMKNNNIGK